MAAHELAIDESVRGRRSAKPIRMLILTSDTYPPRRVDVSVLFGEELAARGHRIDCLLQSETACAAAHVRRWGGGIAMVGATDVGGSLVRRIRKHVLGIAHDLKVFGLLRARRYDLVEVKDKFVSGLFALVAARLFRARFVYWLSFPFPEFYLHAAAMPGCRHPFLYRLRGLTFKLLLNRILLPAADHVFVQSEQMRSDVTTSRVPRGKITAIPMGVKTGPRPAVGIGQRVLIPTRERCFLYLGTLARVRRLDFLVRVLGMVRRSVSDAKLYLIGRGEEPADLLLLTKEAARLGLGSAVVMTGELPREQALRFVVEADVCVSPFYPTPILNSASPTKLVEYMAMGKPVVVNDHPEQRLLIAHSGAGLCVPWDEQAFAAAVIELLDDPELCRSMGERGRRYVERHRSYDKIADLLERELSRVTVAGLEGSR